MRLKQKKHEKKQVVWKIILLIPFFELMVFELLVKKGYMATQVDLIMRFFSACRLLISFICLLTKKRCWSYTAVGFTAFILTENIVSALNGSIYLNFFIGSFTTTGLCLLCAALIRRSYRGFIDACIWFFGTLSLSNAVQCFIMPGGFFNAYYKENAIYILGSKNTCFFFYMVFMYFLMYKEALKKEKPKLTTLLILGFLCAASYVSNSMNAFVMLVLLAAYYCIAALGKRIHKVFSLRFLVTFVIIIAVFVLVPEMRGVFKPVLSMVGRDATFTGRDVLWTQAITRFKNHPLIGNGIHTEFVLGTGNVADHAHSHYLDILAKYGITTLIAFVLTIVFVIKKTVTRIKGANRIIALDCVVLGLFMLHSIIDHLELFNFIIVLISIEMLPAYAHGEAPVPVTAGKGRRRRRKRRSRFHSRTAFPILLGGSS